MICANWLSDQRPTPPWEEQLDAPSATPQAACADYPLTSGTSSAGRDRGGELNRDLQCGAGRHSLGVCGDPHLYLLALYQLRLHSSLSDADRDRAAPPADAE